ncbi:MAG: Stealth CR1 domain-containing protein [Rikenellaceae bacterium]
MSSEQEKGRVDQGIDVVIAWVDGDDPNHARKRRAFLSPECDQTQMEDVAGATRFAAQGEIEFCVLSFLRYAPFVRKIYIVTDEQDPHLEQSVERNFPDNRIPIEIVDHKVLFRGYEEYLPVFNSLSIETMLYRIPTLSERFIYCNDDFMLLGPTTAEEWFEGSAPICCGEKFPTWLARLLRTLKPKRNGHKTFGHKDAMLNAADVMGVSYFGYIAHAPLAQRRRSFESFYELHPEVMKANISHRFRDESQYNPQVLCHLVEDVHYNNCIYKSIKGRTLFLKPTREKPNYMARKLKEADTMEHLVFGCISSLDKANIEQVELFREWFEKRLSITLSR